MQARMILATTVFVTGCFLTNVHSLVQPIKSAKCYITREDQEYIRPSDVSDFLVDSKGATCYEAIIPKYERQLFDKSFYENDTVWKNFASNASANFCPTWNSSKECLSNHISMHCNGDEAKKVEESLYFNIQLALTELACESSPDKNLLYLINNAISGGLWDCLENLMPSDSFRNCSQEGLNGVSSFLTSLTIFNQCMKLELKGCAKDESTKEQSLLVDLEAFIRALQGAYTSIWRKLEH